MCIRDRDTAQDWEEYFDSSVVPMILSNTENKALCVWEECRGFYELEEGRKRIRQLLDWSLALGNEKLISQKRIDGISAVSYTHLQPYGLLLWYRSSHTPEAPQPQPGFPGQEPVPEA